MTRERPVTFDPLEWDTVYQPNQSAQSCAFAHGTELVTKICAQLHVHGKLIIDVGCGTAVAASRLASHGARMVAVDHDPAMIGYARRHVSGADAQSPVTFAVGDALALPLADATCEGLVAVSLAGCLSDLRTFLREVHRVLAPGGWAVITFTNRQSLLLRANNALRVWNRREDTGFVFQLYRSADVATMLRELNFVVRQVFFYNLFMTVGRHMLPPRRIALAMERIVGGPVAARFARNYVTVAIKGPL